MVLITEKKNIWHGKKDAHPQREIVAVREKSEESFKVENQKCENAQVLNKISRYLNQSIRLKEWNTEVDNFSQFLRKVLYSYATSTLKNYKPAAKFPPSDIMYHSDIKKQYRWIRS